MEEGMEDKEIKKLFASCNRMDSSTVIALGKATERIGRVENAIRAFIYAFENPMKKNGGRR